MARPREVTNVGHTMNKRLGSALQTAASLSGAAVALLGMAATIDGTFAEDHSLIIGGFLMIVSGVLAFVLALNLPPSGR
jgi:hypothetical protein